MSDVVGGYILGEKLGHGSFGQIYEATYKFTGEHFAAKVEDDNLSCPQLIFESRIYKIMSYSPNVPKIYFVSESETRNVMIMELMGESIENLLERCNRHMSIKTICMVADQMISAIQFFHMRNYVHRDIKPDNFVVGRGKHGNQIFIIDYGLAKRYRDPISHKHIAYSTGKSLTGTARYASINALAGNEQSRRDDLEGLAYVLIYLAKGNLPWIGIDANDRKEKYDKILQLKKNTSPEKLCKDLPQQFADFLTDVKSLDFEDEPDYSKYRNMFRSLLIEKGDVYDYKYDWCDEESEAFIRVMPRKPNDAFRDSNIFSIPALKSSDSSDNKHTKTLADAVGTLPSFELSADSEDNFPVHVLQKRNVRMSVLFSQTLDVEKQSETIDEEQINTKQRKSMLSKKDKTNEKDSKVSRKSIRKKSIIKSSKKKKDEKEKDKKKEKESDGHHHSHDDKKKDKHDEKKKDKHDEKKKDKHEDKKKDKHDDKKKDKHEDKKKDKHDDKKKDKHDDKKKDKHHHHDSD